MYIMFPEGSWINSARKYYIDNNILYAELLDVNNNWIKNEIVLEANKFYDNYNGSFHAYYKSNSTIILPEGSWIHSARNYYIDNNILFVELLDTNNNWCKNKIVLDPNKIYDNVNGSFFAHYKSYSNINFPEGSWIHSARNYNIDNNVLIAELLDVNNNWCKNEIVLDANKNYENINGSFHGYNKDYSDKREIIGDLDFNNINDNNILINELIKINSNEPYYVIDFVKIINTRFLNYKNKLYIGYINNYNIIKDYIDNYHIQEKYRWYKLSIQNNNNELYKGYYINFMYNGNGCYYHMIFETLLNIFTFLDKNNHLHNNQITILVNDKLNIIKDLFNCNVLTINDNSLIEHLIVPNIKYSYCFDFNKHNIYKNHNIEWFDIDYIKKLREYIFDKFNIKNNLNEKNIFSIIRDNTFRKILNNNILIDIINIYNIEKYYPEKHSFKEQVLKFYSADTVIMQAGSALGNVIFMNENSNLILIYNNSTFINKHIIDVIKELNINLICICTTPIYHRENIFNNNFNNDFLYHPYNADLFLNNFNLDIIINFLNNYFKLNFIKDIFKKNSSDYDNLNYYFIQLENNDIESFLNNNSNLIIKNKKIINYNDLYNVNINNNEKIYENEYITYM
jgi:hypothetical protein